MLPAAMCGNVCGPNSDGLKQEFIIGIRVGIPHGHDEDILRYVDLVGIRFSKGSIFSGSAGARLFRALA